MLDFSKVIERRGTNSEKWDTNDRRLGNTDCIQMGCADMDFLSPPEIVEALQQRVSHGIFGYTALGPHFKDGIISWFKERHHTELSRESILFIPRIVIAGSLCVEAFTRPGDKVILDTPYYPPLHDLIVNNGREAVELPLKHKGNHFGLDLKALEQRIDAKTKMMILVSPHNPTTRVWTKEELQEIADFCVKHDLILFVDEIHADFIAKGKNFVSVAELEGPIQDRLLLCSSPVKTFNIMGCHVAYMIIRNEKLREAFRTESMRMALHEPNAFASTVMEVAYQKCGYYVDEVNQYIDANDAFLREELPKLLPNIEIIPREGSFLMWIDCSKQFKSHEAMMDFFINKAKVYVHPGTTFGPTWRNYIRVNMGCPKATLEEVLKRIKNAIDAN